MIKLIASDLDGTIVDSNHLIPKDNIKAINILARNNIPLVICTGKTYALSHDICQSLNASFGVFGNGSQIIDLKSGKEILKRTLSISEIESCFNIINKYNLHVHAYTAEGIITSKPMYMDLRNFVLFHNKIKLEIVDSVLSNIQNKKEDIFKLIVSSPFHLDKVKCDLEELSNLSVIHITKTGMYKDYIIDKEYEYLDISPLNVNKGSALKFLSNYLNLKKENILSVGDNLNDIEMFKASNISAAVSNSHEKVKINADYITKNSARKSVVLQKQFINLFHLTKINFDFLIKLC